MNAILVKLQPNQDVTEALEAVVADAGMSRGRIVAAVGRLVEGVIRCGDGVAIVAGPGLEIAALSGDIIPGGGTRLHGFVCQQDTSVIEGELVRGRNAVGVTFELLIEDGEAE